MKRKTKTRGGGCPSSAEKPPTLATVLAALETNGALSETRLRDLRSAVKRVAELLGNVPAAIPLVMEKVQAGLGAVNPIAVGMTPKRFTNIRSDFVAAVKASGVIPIRLNVKAEFSPEWVVLFSRLAGRKAHLGLSRLARYASDQGIAPEGINDEVIDGFIAAVREGSLHKKPDGLHRQVTAIWNKVAEDSGLGIRRVAIPSFRKPPQRVSESLLCPLFIEDRENYLAWCGVIDPFADDARPKRLAARTLKLTRDQIHAAVTALVKSGTKPDQIQSLADLVTVKNLKNILRQRVADAGGQLTSFNHYLARALVRIAKEWVKVDAGVLAELKNAASKLPGPDRYDLTPKNKQFLRQFEDPAALRRLQALPAQLWKEVKSKSAQKPNFRVLAKAQAALGIGLLTYMPVRSENLWELEFDRHIFLRSGPGATSTLELDAGEVKNESATGFDIPPHLAKMLFEYRDHIAPQHIGHRPKRLFVLPDGTPKAQSTVSYLICRYARTRAGITLTPHQFRHLSAKVLLDANPGNFEGAKQLLGHKNIKTTLIYSGINSRRAGRHHQTLIDRAVARQMPQPRRGRKKGEGE
jgi:integrase